MKTFKQLITEIKSALNIPPEGQDIVRDLLAREPDVSNAKKILDIFRQYNPRKAGDKQKWKPVSKLGGTKK